MQIVALIMLLLWLTTVLTLSESLRSAVLPLPAGYEAGNHATPLPAQFKSKAGLAKLKRDFAKKKGTEGTEFKEEVTARRISEPVVVMRTSAGPRGVVRCEVPS